MGETFQRFSTAIYSVRAISIILIILFHFGFIFFNILPDQPNRFIQIPFDFGDIGVELFLFLSAMFLCINLCRKEEANIDWKKWYERRISRIFPLLWLSLLFIIPTKILLGTSVVDVNSIVMNMSGLSNISGNSFMGYLWFISFILFCYLIFPLIFLGIKKNLRASIIVVISAFTVYVLIYYPFLSGDLNLINAWVSVARIWNFGFGMIFGYWIGKNKMENLKHLADKKVGILSGLGLAGSFSLYVVVVVSTSYDLGYHYYEKLVLFPIISFFLIVFFTYMFMNLKKANTPFSFIGKMNYEVFLLHGVPIEITLFVIFGILLAPPFLMYFAFPMVLVVAILIAYPLKFLGAWVERNIRASKKFKRGILILAYGVMIYGIVVIIITNFLNVSVDWVISIAILSLILMVLISTELLIRKYKIRHE